MALIYQSSDPLGHQIAVWSISETHDELVLFLNNADFIKEIQNLGLKSDLRIKQKIAAGILLQHITNETIRLNYDDFGKPHLKSRNGQISISNTKELVAVIYHPTKMVGIDIEIPSERILKIASKFVNEKELDWMNASKIIYYQNLYTIWCVKESLFKLIGGGGIDFKNDIIVEKPSNNIGVVQFLKHDNEEAFKYHLLPFDNILVSYIVGN